MRVLRRSLALVILVSLLTGMVPFGSQMENRDFGMAATVQAEARA